MHDHELAHGWRLSDIARLARQSAGTNRTMAADHRDLHDAAWSAIAEHIYTAEHWPSEHDLLAAGRAAIWAIVRAHRTVYGYRDREWDAGVASAPRFCAYWLGQRQVTPSPEGPIVEQETLPRLLAALGDPYRQAIVALAAHAGNEHVRQVTEHDCGHCGRRWSGHTDRDAAACSLGISLSAFSGRLQVARRECLRWWLEHETPRQAVRQRPDRRNNRREVQPCGTPAAARRHRSRGERPCELCAPVERERDRLRKAARRQAVTV
ncbi:hypothetical protein [Micromonospora sp. NPDC005174]|uniref:hypothetical protein n=1 Tax=Micromonospora sp. NPDC005174 TaxID=3157018 RepID=UPI0033A745A3